MVTVGSKDSQHSPAFTFLPYSEGGVKVHARHPPAQPRPRVQDVFKQTKTPRFRTLEGVSPCCCCCCYRPWDTRLSHASPTQDETAGSFVHEPLGSNLVYLPTC